MMSKYYWWEKGTSASPWLGHDALTEGPGGQLKKCLPSASAHLLPRVCPVTQGFHALATPGFSALLLATLPSSTDTHAPHTGSEAGPAAKHGHPE